MDPSMLDTKLPARPDCFASSMGIGKPIFIFCLFFFVSLGVQADAAPTDEPVGFVMEIAGDWVGKRSIYP